MRSGESEESSLMNQTTVKYKLDQQRIEGDYMISSSIDHGEELFLCVLPC